MQLKIEISKDDLGYEPDKVKSLLKKLRPLRKHATYSHLDSIEVYFLFDRGDIDELSLTIIWRVLKSCLVLPCGVTVYYRGTSKRDFDERHFFDSLTGKRNLIYTRAIPIHYGTFSPVRPTKESNQNENLNKALAQVTKEILKPGNEFHGEIRNQMVECIQNAYDHSESKRAESAGILCSVKDGFLDFSIADMGQGVKKSFLANQILHRKFSGLHDTEVLRAATDKGISCNPFHARNPQYVYPNGGIGLYYLKEFVRFHPGSRLVIMSGEGYYYMQYGRQHPRTAALVSWPGTIVHFRTKLDQEKSAGYTKLMGEFLEEFDARPLEKAL